MCIHHLGRCRGCGCVLTWADKGDTPGVTHACALWRVWKVPGAPSWDQTRFSLLFFLPVRKYLIIKLIFLSHLRSLGNSLITISCGWWLSSFSENLSRFWANTLSVLDILFTYIALVFLSQQLMSRIFCHIVLYMGISHIWSCVLGYKVETNPTGRVFLFGALLWSSEWWMLGNSIWPQTVHRPEYIKICKFSNNCKIRKFHYSSTIYIIYIRYNFCFHRWQNHRDRNTLDAFQQPSSTKGAATELLRNFLRVCGVMALKWQGVGLD